MLSTIRPAREDDVPELLALEAVLFDNSMNEGMLLRELRAGEGFVLTQAIGHPGTILGYILTRDDGNVLDITRLGVCKEAQNLGFGTKLLQHVLQKNRPTILTVRKDNRRAVRLYKRHGFVVTGHFIAECAWVLRREPEPVPPQEAS
jgi:ribosomal protein S18 acetylase RimI-like enzyme